MPVAVWLVTALLTGGAALSADQRPAAKRHTLDETEALAKAALAAVLKVRPDDITVVVREERLWPDAAFGCAPRKGVFDPAPTEGYAFTLAHAGKRYSYRSDRYGTVRRCPSAKPRGPAPPAR